LALHVKVLTVCEQAALFVWHPLFTVAQSPVPSEFDHAVYVQDDPEQEWHVTLPASALATEHGVSLPFHGLCLSSL